MSLAVTYPWLCVLLGVLLAAVLAYHGRCVRRWRTERQQWKRVDQQKHGWIATVAHDLRSPFHGILGIADALRSPETLQDAKLRDELLDLIAQSARQGVTVVENLVSLERLRSGQIDFEWEEHLLSALVKIAIQANLQKADCKSQTFVPRFDLGTQAARVRCDAHAMVQVISNLLDRACAHAPALAAIEVRLRRRDAQSVELGVEHPGAGILAQELQSMRELGVEQGMDDRAPVGFYLNVIHSLIEAMGGTLELEELRGRAGSRVWLRFPLVPTVAEKTSEP